MKTRLCDEWTPFPTARGDGFLKFVPDFTDTPPTVTRVPPNVSEVNKGLEAAESRIKDVDRIEDLRILRNRVYTEISDPFHWDLNPTFEMNPTMILETIVREMRNTAIPRLEMKFVWTLALQRTDSLL